MVEKENQLIRDDSTQPAASTVHNKDKLIKAEDADAPQVVDTDPLTNDLMKQAAAQEAIVPAFLKGVFINGKSKKLQEFCAFAA